MTLKENARHQPTAGASGIPVRTACALGPEGRSRPDLSPALSSVGGITPNTLDTRIKELRAAGLLDHGSDGYRVTPSGADLLKRLADLPAFAAKWTASQAKKAS